MSELSKDANDLASGLFFGGMNTEVSFGMVESVPSDRCQIGLDELVDKGYLEFEELKPKGAKYKPTSKLVNAKLSKIDRKSGLTITRSITESL